MACLIDDLLKLSKVSRHELCPCDVSLGSHVEEARCEMESEIANRNIEWRVVQCDRGLMKQVFVNLLSNAVKYARPRDPAIIEVSQSFIDDEPIYSVRANGVGFDS